MKNKNLIISIIILFIINSCVLVMYDDVNKYRGSVIINIEIDSVGEIPVHRIAIKDVFGRYDILNVTPSYGELFNVGDTL